MAGRAQARSAPDGLRVGGPLPGALAARVLGAGPLANGADAIPAGDRIACSPSSPVQRIALMKGAQIGGTECGNCWVGYVIHQAPGPMMAVAPTVELAKRNSKQRIDPLIEESEVLRERVYERREPYRISTVPEAGLFLTAGADVQTDRVEVEVVAWGRGKESWSVDYRVIEGDTARPDVWAKLDAVLARDWPHASGHTLAIRVMGVVAGYATEDVYACRNRRTSGDVQEASSSVLEFPHSAGSGAPPAGAVRCERGARRKAGAVPRICRAVSPNSAREGSIRRALGSRDQVPPLPHTGAPKKGTACHLHPGRSRRGRCVFSRSPMLCASTPFGRRAGDRRLWTAPWLFGTARLMLLHQLLGAPRPRTCSRRSSAGTVAGCISRPNVPVNGRGAPRGRTRSCAPRESSRRTPRHIRRRCRRSAQ